MVNVPRLPSLSFLSDYKFSFTGKLQFKNSNEELSLKISICNVVLS